MKKRGKNHRHHHHHHHQVVGVVVVIVFLGFFSAGLPAGDKLIKNSGCQLRGVNLPGVLINQLID